jgi:hypothetical protein
MNQKEALDRMLVEIRIHSITNSEDYTPTPDHYVPIRLLRYYMTLAYSIGFDARCEYVHNHNSKRIAKTKNGEIIKIYDSIEDAAKKMEVNHKSISIAANKPNRTCKGFHWEFIS